MLEDSVPARVGWRIGVDPDGDLGDKCGGGGRDKSLDFRVRLEYIASGYLGRG